METGAWEWSAALIKLLTYGGTLSGAGAAFFLVYNAHLIPASARVALQRTVGGCALLALLGTLIKIPLMAASMSGDARGMLDVRNLRMMLNGGESIGTLLRIAGLLLMSAAVLIARRSLSLAAVGAVLASTSFAWTGHIHAQHSGALTLLLMLHLLCAAFWIGALWPLYRVLKENDPALSASIVNRFSRIALATVPALLVAGAVLLTRLLGGVRELWSSDYGRLMSAKLCLVALLLSVAALNKQALTPRLASSQGAQALARSIVIEMLLAAGILAVTAAFTTFSGPGE